MTPATLPATMAPLWPLWPLMLPWLASVYGVASVICFILYAADKSAAIQRRQRVSERTLLLCGLACGWPGGWLAQRCLRHKSVKRSFQRAFWCSAALNVAALAALAWLYASLYRG